MTKADTGPGEMAGRGDPSTVDRLLLELQERAKELNTLYRVEEILRDDTRPIEETLQLVVGTLPPGWQYPEVCEAAIRYEGKTYSSSDFNKTPWLLSVDIVVQERAVGRLRVYYTERMPDADQGPFLKEEVDLANSIAERLGYYILFHELRDMRDEWADARAHPEQVGAEEWRAPVHLLRQADRTLYLRIARRMLNQLCSLGIPEAHAMLREVESWHDAAQSATGEVNVAGQRQLPDYSPLMGDELFELASEHLSDDEILGLIRKWMQQDKATFFSKVLDSPRSSLPEIAEALRRFGTAMAGGIELALSTRRSFRVTLARRFLTTQLDFIRVARDFMHVKDYLELIDNVILPQGSHGLLGGKSTGLILADKILERAATPDRPIGDVKIPRTWYIASDGLLEFIVQNDLEDVIEQKFKDIDLIRQEYPNIIQLFKNSSMPPDIENGLSQLLDTVGETPLIVRSSSLLEDRLGTAFSGKYKSLFVPNQGTKAERLEALSDAIAEVYASTFGPDPIEYRRQHGLLEFYEEMGVIIQEVVGTRVGKYFLPAFAGVAYSRNEFRWSPRIRREDGLIRLVPGLGTRAVDRVPDDYAILIAPGQPQLRVNTSVDEVVRYSPKKVDAINLATNTLETVTLDSLVRESGGQFPALEQVFSKLDHDVLSKPVRLLVDPERDDLVATFEGLVSDTAFVEQIGNIMATLRDHLGAPVDIEFAHDGKDFYLLQCRPQSYAEDEAPAPIPKDVALDDVVFSAEKHVSNGWVPDISHIVYVDPAAYAELGSRAELLDVGRAVGQLNKLLPHRSFILMGPGRWGSRGDIKLGVSVGYSDINNSAMLIEIARKKGGYLPDLSFGTHFFQDLVEARIRYLPLYPDDEGIRFNERFLRGAPNLLPEILPEFAHLADVVRVIDVPASSGGRVLRVNMNADLGEALGHLAEPSGGETEPATAAPPRDVRPSEYWLWRQQMAERIASELDGEAFGVKAMYLFGSTKNASAGPASDIDLLVHFDGTDEQRAALENWLEGWSLALSEMNYLKTGYRTGKLLDAHIITDEDIANRTSYAVKIGAATDPARELELKRVATDVR
ncbi:MAG: PEP/pyruvate-binding domain-containing protein [Anaerolineae bacterium]